MLRPRKLQENLENTCNYTENCQAIDNLGCPGGSAVINMYRDKTPLFSAEELCAVALAEIARAQAEKQSKRSFSLLHSNIDAALALSVHDTNKAMTQLQQASNLITETKDTLDLSVGSNRVLHAKLRFIESFMPLYAERIFNQTINPETVADTHSNLCDLLVDLNNRYLYDHPDISADDTIALNSARTEVDVAALLTREWHGSEYVPFPALRREESSPRSRKRKDQAKNPNHDIYCLQKGFEKAPIQVKTSSAGLNYPEIIVITHKKITNMALGRYRSDRKSPNDSKNFNPSARLRSTPSLTDLLLAEKFDGDHDIQATELLDVPTHFITATIDSYRKNGAIQAQEEIAV